MSAANDPPDLEQYRLYRALLVLELIVGIVALTLSSASVLGLL